MGNPIRRPSIHQDRRSSDGWKFRFNLESPEAGFLYLINEGPGSEGVPSLHVLYPTGNPQRIRRRARTPARSDKLVSLRSEPGDGTVLDRVECSRGAGDRTRETVGQRCRSRTGQGSARGGNSSTAAGVLRDRDRTSKNRATKRTVIEGPANVLASRADLEHH